MNAFIFIKIQQYSIFFTRSIEKIKKTGILNLKIVTNTKEREKHYVEI